MAILNVSKEDLYILLRTGGCDNGSGDRIKAAEKCLPKNEFKTFLQDEYGTCSKGIITPEGKHLVAAWGSEGISFGYGDSIGLTGEPGNALRFTRFTWDETAQVIREMCRNRVYTYASGAELHEALGIECAHEFCNMFDWKGRRDSKAKAMVEYLQDEAMKLNPGNPDGLYGAWDDVGRLLLKDKEIAEKCLRFFDSYGKSSDRHGKLIRWELLMLADWKNLSGGKEDYQEPEYFVPGNAVRQYVLSEDGLRKVFTEMNGKASRSEIAEALKKKADTGGCGPALMRGEDSGIQFNVYDADWDSKGIVLSVNFKGKVLTPWKKVEEIFESDAEAKIEKEEPETTSTLPEQEPAVEHLTPEETTAEFNRKMSETARVFYAAWCGEKYRIGMVRAEKTGDGEYSYVVYNYENDILLEGTAKTTDIEGWLADNLLLDGVKGEFDEMPYSEYIGIVTRNHNDYVNKESGLRNDLVDEHMDYLSDPAFNTRTLSVPEKKVVLVSPQAPKEEKKQAWKPVHELSDGQLSFADFGIDLSA